MSLSNFLHDYFVFHKKERSGILLFLLLLLISIIVSFSYRIFKSEDKPDTAQYQKQLDEFLSTREIINSEEPQIKDLAAEISEPAIAPAQLFVFNPNTATEDDFVRLGLTKRQASGILNYRSKGGKFRKKEDFAKMYTISKFEYDRLEAFIVIPEEEKKQDKLVAEEKIYPEKKEYQAKQTVVEINSADSIELIMVKGIGPYTAMKIIELRKSLGGFYSKEQLREIYRMDSARYAEIESFLTLDPFEVKKINLNTATLEELKNHPYIRYNIANSLVSIRQQHGKYKNIEDIKKSHLVTEDVFRKIAPYLTIE